MYGIQRFLGPSQECIVVFDIRQVVSSVKGSREAANLLDLDQTHCVIPPPALIGPTLELNKYGWRQHVGCRKTFRFSVRYGTDC